MSQYPEYISNTRPTEFAGRITTLCTNVSGNSRLLLLTFQLAPKMRSINRAFPIGLLYIHNTLQSRQLR